MNVHLNKRDQIANDNKVYNYIVNHASTSLLNALEEDFYSASAKAEIRSHIAKFKLLWEDKKVHLANAQSEIYLNLVRRKKAGEVDDEEESKINAKMFKEGLMLKDELEAMKRLAKEFKVRF